MVLAQTQTARTARTLRKAERIALHGQVRTNDKHRFAKRKLYVLNMTAKRVSEIDV